MTVVLRPSSCAPAEGRCAPGNRVRARPPRDLGPGRWDFDAQDIDRLRGGAAPSAPRVPAPPGRSARGARLAGAAGMGLVGAALLSAAPAQAAPIEFPAWASVTGTVPEDTGLDRAAAEANDWTFSWSTDAAGVVTFEYADGSRSSSLDPTARHAAAPVPAEDAGDLAVQSLGDPLWAEDAGADDPRAPGADPGLEDLAAAASSPFGVGPGGADASAAGPTEDGRAGGRGAQTPDQALLDTAAQGLGGQYVWGGTEFKAWDCSAFVQWVYARHGIELPRVTWQQFAAAEPTADPRPGDLVSQNGGAHVGIYLGGDRMISALNPQQGTIEHSVHDMPLDGYYTMR